MPTSFFETAREIVVPILPLASDNPAWSGPSPAQIGPTYGTLIARRGARNSWVMHHDRAERHFALTIYDAASPPSEIALHGRRFKVVRAEAGPPCAA